MLKAVPIIRVVQEIAAHTITSFVAEFITLQ